MICNPKLKQWESKLIDTYRRESNVQNQQKESGMYNQQKVDIMDYLEGHLSEVDKIFTGYMFHCDKSDADAFKLASIKLYRKAWKKRFSLIKGNSYLKDLEDNPQFPPTFDDIVDDYIEKETGSRPTISYRDIEEVSIDNPLGLFA